MNQFYNAKENTSSDCVPYLCKELGESLVIRDVTYVSGVEMMQRRYICLVHLILHAVHLI